MAVKRRQDQDILQMNDVQLLAYLISLSGADATSAREAARTLLGRHQSLRRVLELPGKTLLAQPGLGENAAVFLMLLPALIHRYGAPTQRRSLPLEDQEELQRLLLPHFFGQSTERVYAFFLDDALGLISQALCAQGGAAAVSCSVRRVLELALNHQAKGVILAHNHPDGAPRFSKSDLMATGTLFQALSTVGIPLLDHFLLAGEDILSLRKLTLERQVQPFSPHLPRSWFPQT